MTLANHGRMYIFEAAGLGFDNTTGTITIQQEGLYYVNLTYNKAAGTPSGSRFGYAFNGIPQSAPDIPDSGTAGNGYVIVSIYLSAGDTIQALNLSTFPVALSQGSAILFI
ncbi:hypothetical protein ABDI30_23830 [Paenibacillus cisolokensis]|uniref:hypothetical protein n=1 Tax=Paenibacillus cisolokensis TaxID=1658519 RepID=UPI003D2D8C5E